MFKNKKIVLSSIAIIFALVVSSIFVNYTLANSDSQASLSDANGSGSTSTSLTGLSNIDLAVKNSNDAGKKQTGEDKFRIGVSQCIIHKYRADYKCEYNSYR